MKILIVGAGMYVTGRDNSGTGTILASILQSSKKTKISEVLIVARNPDNRIAVREARERLNGILGTQVPVEYLPLRENSYEHFSELLAREFDCCIISTPDHLHFEYAKLAMQAACPTLVVKPLVPTAEENVRLIELQDRYRTYGAVEFHKRWDETNLYIKRQLSDGYYGRPLYMVVEYSQRISIPTETFSSWVQKTNIFQYLGVHYVDMAYFLTGYRPLRLTAYGTRGTLAERGIADYDSVHVSLVWQNPAQTGQEFLTNFNTNWIDPESTTAMSDQKYFLVGTEGRIDCNQKNRGLEEVTRVGGAKSINPYFSDFLPYEEGVRFVGYGHKSIKSFLLDVAGLNSGKRTVAQLEKIRPTFRSSLVSSAVVEAVNQSLKNSSSWTPVELDWTLVSPST